VSAGVLLLFAATFCIVSAFVAYWMGRGAAERQTRIIQARLQSATELNVALAEAHYNLRRRLGHLTPDEAAAFFGITDNYREEAS
jgi:hypothetical protein